jgi:hypothetical protein
MHIFAFHSFYILKYDKDLYSLANSLNKQMSIKTNKISFSNFISRCPIISAYFWDPVVNER